jgi:hypothetical protein
MAIVKRLRRRKRVSLRRWKARARLGRKIPAIAMVEHRLDRWFQFVMDPVADYGVAGR